MRNNDVENRISDSFKKLLCKNSMEKITVKELSEASGVIRPTFYNHFRDKYDVLEYIIRTELLEPIKPLLENDMIQEATALLFSNMKNDKTFYEHAIRIQGQNSFESIAKQEVTKLLSDVIKKKYPDKQDNFGWLTTEVLAEYYAHSMCYIAITWVKSNVDISPKAMSEIYTYMTEHSMLEVIQEYSNM